MKCPYQNDLHVYTIPPSHRLKPIDVKSERQAAVTKPQGVAQLMEVLDMSAIGASLAGAAVFAVAAIWLSLQGWLARRSPTFSVFGEPMKMLATGVIAAGLCLIALSVAVTAGIGAGWVSLIALMITPITFIMIWRSVDIALSSPDGDRTGGVASARRIIDLSHDQNLRTA